jgi:imidazolonepropionase-like amidohydrolase
VRTTVFLTAAAAVLLAAAASRATAQVAAQPPLEVFHGFTLIDGSGGPPIQDAAISVRGNSIVTVGSRSELLSGPSAPRDAIVVNLGGGWVVPGLIDAHVHLSTTPDRAAAEAELHRLLHGGITAVRDMAGDARALASLARDSRLGEIEGPDVHFAALMAGPSFMSDPRPRAAAAGETAGEVPWIQAITHQTDITTAVARAAGTYATGIKIHADLDADLVAALTEEAHRQGLRVWAHSLVVPARPIEVIRAGVDVLSHACDLAWEAMAQVPERYDHGMRPRYGSFTADAPVFTQLFDEMKLRGTILDPTLATYARAQGRAGSEPAPAGCDVGFARELVSRARAEGVRIAAGSDFATPPEDAFPALFSELEELVSGAGLSPMDAIVAATRGAAEAIGIEETHGLLAHGRPVSFVLLRESPLEDISNLRSVAAVWKNAVRYDRSSYRSRFRAPELAAPRARTVAGGGPATPDALLEAWLGMWRRHDLDMIDDVFLDDDVVTYYASDREGLIQGIDAIREYHAGLGFASGGFRPEMELWLERVNIADFGESAVIGAVWYFGDRLDRRATGRGPLTMALARTVSGFKIAHVNFGKYAPER